MNKHSGAIRVVKSFVALFVIVFLLLQVFLVSAVVEFGDYWVTKTSMAAGYSGTGIAASNGVIYVIGEGVNEMYNPATDTWTSKTPMPTNRTHFGIVSYGNKIYVLGGFSDAFGLLNGTTAINEVYDMEKDSWETKAFMPTERGDFSANVVDGKIYVVGGYKRGMNEYDIGYRFDVNYVYDIATDTWSNKTPSPQEGDRCRSVVIDNKIHLLRGGSPSFLPLNGAVESQHLIYDTVVDVWSFGALMPTSVVGEVGATTGDLAPKRLYVVGGGSKDNLVQVYDPEADTWSTGVSMPTSRRGFSVAVVDDCLYVLGGVDTSSDRNPVNTVEMYVPSGHKNADQSPNLTPAPDSILITSVVVIVVVVIAVVFVIALRTKIQRKSNNYEKQKVGIKENGPLYE